jgi:hypothetical protein
VKPIENQFISRYFTAKPPGWTADDYNTVLTELRELAARFIKEGNATALAEVDECILVFCRWRNQRLGRGTPWPE